ncbi:hypothetical protein FHR32_007466 [Streptosporangium album]|uniref:Uncharacterized protein n=1 Tax=Streptosporangium album TaxID=47479 RepID=A0A7W7WDF5_9ACTN|nr:hypothetical protein [Streptosporangium album]MBB4943066.1 hypothetical protein [Streptosporangium album]
MNGYIDLGALSMFVATGLVCGVGLVAVYAAGLLGLSIATADTSSGVRRLLGSLLAGVAFLTVVVGVGVGLYVTLGR